MNKQHMMITFDSDSWEDIKKMLGRPYQKHDNTDFYIWSSQIGTYESLVNLRRAIIKKFKVNKKTLEVDGWKWNKNVT